MSAAERIAFRTKRRGHWIKRLRELKAEEANFKKSLDSWKEMLHTSGYSDLDVFGELAFGTRLVGEIPPTGLWPRRFQPQTITEQDLRCVARRKRGSLADRGAGVREVDFCEEVWQQTLDEVKSGALIGPLSIDSIPEDCPLSKRFGIQQDDFSMSSVNSCVQCTESPKPHTSDFLAAVMAELMATRAASSETWLGRAFDLKCAYRQCAVRPSSKMYSHIFVQEPIETLKLWAFQMRALPFGAVRSVHGFLRVSASLWYLLTKEFLILTTNYFDDYVEAASITACVHLFFRITGWRFAETGPKAPDFAELFQAVGISINVTDLHCNVVQFDNIESRKTELVRALTQILEDGRLIARDAFRLRGRLQFASGQIFGRVARAALNAITSHAYNRRREVLDDETKFYLDLRRRFLQSTGPRVVRPSDANFSFILTDAFFESSGGPPTGGIGAVV